MKEEQLKAGQAVKVKKGIEVDGLDISNWQGRIGIFEREDTDFILVEWDSITMQNLSEKYIISSLRMADEEDLNHFYLDVSDVEKAKPRDSLKDVEKVKEELCRKYRWKANNDGSPEEELLEEIMPLIEEGEIFWTTYLEENLELPFTAIVENIHQYSEIEVEVSSIVEDEDDLRGVIVGAYFRGKKLYFPLHDIYVEDESSYNYVLVEAYKSANH